jgi:hypothetical protein
VVLVEQREHIDDRSIRIRLGLRNSGKRKADLDCNDRPHKGSHPQISTQKANVFRQ